MLQCAAAAAAAAAVLLAVQSEPTVSPVIVGCVRNAATGDKNSKHDNAKMDSVETEIQPKSEFQDKPTMRWKMKAQPLAALHTITRVARQLNSTALSVYASALHCDSTAFHVAFWLYSGFGLIPLVPHQQRKQARKAR